MICDFWSKFSQQIIQIQYLHLVSGFSRKGKTWMHDLCWSCIFAQVYRSACSYTSTAVFLCSPWLYSFQWFAFCNAVQSLCQFIVTLRFNNVYLYVCVAVYTVLMLIYPNGQHYQLVGFLLLCRLNSSITLLLQFPPETAGLKVHRSYQHNSLMTTKVPGWRKHECARAHS